MDNAVDALYMAAAVLIFVLALSISINAFGQVQQATTTILGYKDREYDYTYVENNGTTRRIVSAETIVPSIYKAYKENYKIVFMKNNGEAMELYKKSNGNAGKVSVYSIDLEKDVLGNDEQKERFIRCLLYGGNSDYWSDIDNFEDSGIYLSKNNFYDTIKGNIFEEKLGVYYQEEIQGTSTADTNKTEKRVITYVQR